MSSLRRRTHFAAPFIVVLGCGGSRAPEDPPRPQFPGETWTVMGGPSECTATGDMGGCPKGVMCNPPPPRSIECPDFAGATSITVGQRPDKTCAIVPVGCTSLACATQPTPCPPEWGTELKLKGPFYQAARIGENCFAWPEGTCAPPDTSCALALECPVGTPTEWRIAQRDQTCFLRPGDCDTRSCLGGTLPCPLPAGKDFARRWEGKREGDACSVTFTGSLRGAQTAAIPCPSELGKASYFRIDRKPTESGCVLRIGPEKPVDIACP